MSVFFGEASLFRGVLSAFFPSSCAGCLRPEEATFCLSCARLLEPAPRFSIEGVSEARAVFSFEGPVKSAVHRLKYRGAPEIGRRLGALLGAELPMLGHVDLVVPVPLSSAKLRARGYNQARELARALPLPVRARALTRASEAAGQVGLGRSARLANALGRISPGRTRIEGASILLLDDVVTTGATARAAAQALLSAGARRVVFLALARTPAQSDGDMKSGVDVENLTRANAHARDRSTACAHEGETPRSRMACAHEGETPRSRMACAP